MKIRLLSIFLLLIFTACQHGGSAPAIPVTAPPAVQQVQDATPTYNIVTLVVPTRTLAATQAQLGNAPTTVPLPTISPTAQVAGERPLLIPRILKAEYIPQVTRLVVGFDFHPVYRNKPEVFAEIYDSTLTDQTGREIPGVSTEMSRPDQVILEFDPLPPGATSLTLRAQLALRGVPAQAPLAIDVSGHGLDQPWPIQTQVRFGDLGVRLHTARLLRDEIGAPPDAKHQISLELRGDNLDLDGAQLICLALTPLPAPVEGSMSCGQEPGGIQATVSLGSPVDRSAALPMPAGLVLLEAAGDFLLPGYWETTFPVE